VSKTGKAPTVGKPAARAKGQASARVLVWVVVLAIVALVGFLLLKPAGGAGGVKVVDSAGLIAAQQAGAQVVDVRTAGEFQLGHIPGAINVPVDQIQATAASWDKKATYVIYCASGARSAQAVQDLAAMGFKNLDHFDKGIQAWTGKLDSGQQSSSQTIQTSGKPVFIEFYTNS
jgi:rhodanese-related sulfurtransferase